MLYSISSALFDQLQDDEYGITSFSLSKKDIEKSQALFHNLFSALPSKFSSFENKKAEPLPKFLSKYFSARIYDLLYHQTILETDLKNPDKAVESVIRACYLFKVHDASSDIILLSYLEQKKQMTYEMIVQILNKITNLTPKHMSTLYHAYEFCSSYQYDALKYEQDIGKYTEEEIELLYKNYPLKMFWCDMANNPSTTAVQILQQYNQLVENYFKNDGIWSASELSKLDEFASAHHNIVFSQKYSSPDFTAKKLLSLLSIEAVLKSVFTKTLQNDPATKKPLDCSYFENRVVFCAYGLDQKKDPDMVSGRNANDIRVSFPESLFPEQN